MDIKIEYILKKSEFLDGYDTYESTQLSFKIDLIISPFLIALAIYIFFQNAGFNYALLAICFILVGIITLVPRLSLSRFILGLRFEKNKKSKLRQVIEFSDEGLSYFIENANSKLSWDFYSKIIEGKKTIVMIYGNRQYSVVPKSAFTEEQLIQFKELCSKKLRPIIGST